MKNLAYIVEIEKAKSEMEDFGLNHNSIQNAIAHMYGIDSDKIKIIGFNLKENSIRYMHGAEDSAVIHISDVTMKEIK